MGVLMTQESSSDVMQSEGSSPAVCSVVPGKHTGGGGGVWGITSTNTCRLKLNILFAGKQHVRLAGRRLGKHVGSYPTSQPAPGVCLQAGLQGSDLRQNGSLVGESFSKKLMD